MSYKKEHVYGQSLFVTYEKQNVTLFEKLQKKILQITSYMCIVWCESMPKGKLPQNTIL